MLETLVYLKRETDVWFEITTLLIPGENDSDAELDAMTRWIAAELGPDVPLHFTAFHPDWKMRDRPPTPPATLAPRAPRSRCDNGLRYVYTGNVHDEEGGTTYCHALRRASHRPRLVRAHRLAPRPATAAARAAARRSPASSNAPRPLGQPPPARSASPTSQPERVGDRAPPVARAELLTS